MYKISRFENFRFRILYKSDDLISDSPEQITTGSINLGILVVLAGRSCTTLYYRSWYPQKLSDEAYDWL